MRRLLGLMAVWGRACKTACPRQAWQIEKNLKSQAGLLRKTPAAYCTIFSPAYPSMFVKSQSESTPADKGFSSGRAVATTWRVIASTDQIARMHQTLLLYSLRQQHPRLLSTGTRLLVASNASDCCKALPSQIRPPQTLT